ncbi:hypothetical protein [Alkalihalobacillus trypoxylicola]|uniref:Uncharacterized protein n=1 Tax=Alkalihalobacillus trypoxylicola TaxID=519424 RepID=A0A161PM50_9BACI|nr:hypothetical protein [Alkalihalobacillus trypoxylicola]KYG35083.1 hypothetical protein AZF04_01745 [Alkalihalobacillus trypoxylicola]
MFSFKKVESDKLLPYVMSIGVILILTSLIVPMVAILFIQDFLFFSSSHWTFIRPSEAFIGFGLGMVWIAVVLFSLFFSMKWSEIKDKDYRWGPLHVLLGCLSIPIFLLSIYHYIYLDEQGVHEISIWSFSEEGILWEDIDHTTRLVQEGSQITISYTFSDGERDITIPHDPQDYLTNTAIDRAIDTHQLMIIDEIQSSD